MGHHVLGGVIVELEDVLDHFLFVFLDGAALAAHVHHHADFFLGDLLRLGVGVNADEPQDAVGAGGQEPHHGLEERGAYLQHAIDLPGILFRVLHGDALWHQLAQHQGEIGQNQGNQHHAQGIEHCGIHRSPRCEKGSSQPGCELIRRECAAQEARQGDAHLDGGQELVGRLGQAKQLRGHMIALVGVMAQLGLVQGQHCHLRGSKEAIDQDQNQLKQ